MVMSGAFVVYTFWPILVFVIQTRAFTREAVEGPVSFFEALRRPVGWDAQAHRAFALLMSVLLLLSLLAFAESLSLISLQSLISSLASIYILFLVSFVFVYVNNAPSPSSFMAKLVGIPLVTLLLVMGNMGSFILETLEERFDEDRKAELKFALKSVVEEDFAFLPKYVNHVYVYPLESKGGVDLREEVYRNPDIPLSEFHKQYQAPVFTNNVIEIMRREGSVDPDLAKEWALEQINRTDVLAWSQEFGYFGMIRDLRCSVYYFTVTGFLFEVTYDRMFYGRHIDSYAWGLILFILGSTIVILLLFPKFFKSSLNGPLQSLLGGMRAVNDGDMSVEVPVHTDDEFGFLTRSFNGMVGSIRVAEDRLKRYASELEEANETLESRVEDRTRDLNEKNVELEQTLVELQETQNQLMLQEKMASVGQLVAGLAHEINNPIGVVSSSADVARRCVIQIDEIVAAC